MVTVSTSRAAGSLIRPPASAPLTDQHAARAQQPQRRLGAGAELGRVGVDEDQVVDAVGQPGQHVQRRPVMIRVRDGAKPASTKMRRAIRWCSFSTSMVVSTPSARMPRSSQTPLTPVPVPISTTALALPAAASSRSTRPRPG
jgi:hypothetical protein